MSAPLAVQVLDAAAGYGPGSAPPEPRPFVLSVGRLPVPLARL